MNSFTEGAFGSVDLKWQAVKKGTRRMKEPGECVGGSVGEVEQMKTEIVREGMEEEREKTKLALKLECLRK